MKRTLTPAYLARREYHTAYNNTPKRKYRVQEWWKENSAEEKRKRQERHRKDPRLALRYSLAKYTLDLETYDAMVIERAGHCDICGEPPIRCVFHIDHNNRCCPGTGSCGKCLRGLLCQRCNTMIGLAKESTQTLANAIEYLKKHSQKP